MTFGVDGVIPTVAADVGSAVVGIFLGVSLRTTGLSLGLELMKKSAGVVRDGHLHLPPLTSSRIRLQYGPDDGLISGTSWATVINLFPYLQPQLLLRGQLPTTGSSYVKLQATLPTHHWGCTAGETPWRRYRRS